MSLRKIIVLLAAVLVAALVGCATKDNTGRTLKPGHGIVEYQQVTTDGIKAVRAALNSLQSVSGYTNGVPSKSRAAFITQVERLEVDSIQVRARSQAILARGDAYFENWKENLSRVEDPVVRELANEHRPQLEASFGIIKSTSQRARQSFQPFLAGLRQLRTAVENDPRAMVDGSGKDLARTTAEHGRQVEQELSGIRYELNRMLAMLKPAKPNLRH